MREKEQLSWEEMYDFEVSNLVTEARIHKGWTQERLAKAIGTKQAGIARLESGASRPSHLTLLKIAKAIGMKLLAPKFAPRE